MGVRPTRSTCAGSGTALTSLRGEEVFGGFSSSHGSARDSHNLPRPQNEVRCWKLITRRSRQVPEDTCGLGKMLAAYVMNRSTSYSPFLMP